MKKIYNLIFIFILFSCENNKGKIEYHQNLELIWKAKKINWNTSSLILYNEHLYGHTINDSIFKMDFNTGKEIWKRYSKGSYATLTPKIYRNKIFIGGADGLKAFDLTGKLIWAKRTNSKTIGITLIDSTVINTRTNQGVFANDIKNGNELWKIEPDFQMLSMSDPINIDSLLVLGNFNYQEKEGGHLTCVNINNRKIKWEIASRGYLTSPVNIDSLSAFFNSDSIYKKGFTFRADLHTGDILWKTETNPVVFYKPLINNNKILIASYEKGVICLNTNDGRKLWELDKDFYPDTEFLLHNEILYFGTTNRQLIGVNNEGEIIFKSDFEYGIGNPFVHQDEIFVNDGNGRLFKIKKYCCQ